MRQLKKVFRGTQSFAQSGDMTIQIAPSYEGWTIRFFTEDGQVTVTCDADHLRMLAGDIQDKLKKAIRV